MALESDSSSLIEEEVLQEETTMRCWIMRVDDTHAYSPDTYQADKSSHGAIAYIHTRTHEISHFDVHSNPKPLPHGPVFHAFEVLPEIFHVLHEPLQVVVGRELLCLQADSRQRVKHPALIKIGLDTRPLVSIARIFENDGIGHDVHGDGALDVGHDVGGLEPFFKGQAAIDAVLRLE